jgi:hypothetical protein
MDADYLKKNVNEAVSEALAALAVGMPDDKVEYMGQYLKSYCERKRVQARISAEAGEAESKWSAFEVENASKKAEVQAKVDAKAARADRLTDFLMELENNATNKKAAMDQVVAFAADYLNVPACYIGVKKTINEVDTLYYYSANESNVSKVVGKKLTVPQGEGEEDAPKRQGVTFNVFKVPEVEPVEPPEDAPEGWTPPPPPGPQPLVVDNCMRDTRCKFFGIPKLGSFLAVPLVYSSSDHTEGIVVGEAPAAAPVEAKEGEEAPPPAEPKQIWVQQKTVSQSLALCVDTIGSYRAFSQADIDTLKTIGAKLVNVMESIELKQFNEQSEYLTKNKGNAEVVAAAMAALAESEAAALAAIAPVEGQPETERVLAAARSALANATAVVTTNADISSLVTGLTTHVLPPVPAVINLAYTVSLLLGVGAGAKDVYGEITWKNLIDNCLPVVISKISSAFDATSVDKALLAEVKAFIEANAVLPGEYPGTCAACTPLAYWLGKALAVADAKAAHDAFLSEQAASAQGSIGTKEEEE